MKKFLRKVVKSFKQLADAKLFAFAQNVTTSMANAVDVFPTPIPTLPILILQLAIMWN